MRLESEMASQINSLGIVYRKTVSMIDSVCGKLCIPQLAVQGLLGRVSVAERKNYRGNYFLGFQGKN